MHTQLMGISVSGSSASFVDGLVLGLLIAVLAALVWTTFSAKVRKPETLFNGVLATATLALAFVSILQWLTSATRIGKLENRWTKWLLIDVLSLAFLTMKSSSTNHSLLMMDGPQSSSKLPSEMLANPLLQRYQHILVYFS